MTIKTHLSQKDFIYANLVLLYNKWNMKFISGIAIFMFVFGIYGLFADSRYSSGSGSELLVGIFMFTWIPLLTYFNARKNYTSNNRISEHIDYIIENDELTIKGESFNSTLSWDKFYKVSKTKNWILIWQSKQTANLIPRRDITDNEIGYLKKILVQHKVKNNL